MKNSLSYSCIKGLNLCRSCILLGSITLGGLSNGAWAADALACPGQSNTCNQQTQELHECVDENTPCNCNMWSNCDSSPTGTTGTWHAASGACQNQSSAQTQVTMTCQPN